MEKPYGMDAQIEERPRVFIAVRRKDEGSDIGRNYDNLDALEQASDQHPTLVEIES